ncbi:MAG TPA: hypothetical protein VJ650_14505 [Gemmatimonadaceae bacterium]|nr:hypothetical protein [Gemmatimonadaceae bacterium]
MTATGCVMLSADLRWMLVVALLACAPAARDTADTVTVATETAHDSAVPADTTPPQWIVRADGIGPLRVGVPLTDASRTLGETLRVTQAGCDHVNPTRMPDGILLMVIDDTVARVEIDSAGIRTTEGAQVGDSESRVLELYGARARIEPHKYTYPDGHYVVVTPPGDTLHRIIFETLKGRVTTYRAGRVPAVQLVEGCG